MAASPFPPGLAGYMAMQEANSQLDQRNISGLSQLQQIAANQYKMGRQRAYEEESANAKGPEELFAIASKYLGPEAAAKMLQDEKLKMAHEANTKEIAGMRLQAQESEFNTKMRVAFRNAATSEDRNRIREDYYRGMLYYRGLNAQLGINRYEDKTGNTFNMHAFPTEEQLAGATTAPGAAAAGGPAGTPPTSALVGGQYRPADIEAAKAGRSPAEQAAIDSAARGVPKVVLAPQLGEGPIERGTASFDLGTQPAPSNAAPGPSAAPVVSPVSRPPADFTQRLPLDQELSPVPVSGLNAGSGLNALVGGPTPPVAPPVSNQYRDEGSRAYVPGPEPGAPGPIAASAPPPTPVAPLPRPVPTAALTGSSPSEPAPSAAATTPEAVAAAAAAPVAVRPPQKVWTSADAPPRMEPEEKRKWAAMKNRYQEMANLKGGGDVGGAVGVTALPREEDTALAWRYILYGSLPYRKGSGGGSDRNDAIVREAVRIGKELDMTFQEIAAMPAAFKSDAMALTQQNKKLAAIEAQLDSFHNNIDTWDNIAKGLPPKLGGRRVQEFASQMEKINFVGVQSLDDVKLRIQQQFNDPNVAAYVTASMAVAMDYARIMTGPQSAAQLTEGARADALRLINSGMDDKARQGLLAALDSDTEGQRKALEDSTKNIRTRMGLRGGLTAADRSTRTKAPDNTVPTTPGKPGVTISNW